MKFLTLVFLGILGGQLTRGQFFFETGSGDNIDISDEFTFDPDVTSECMNGYVGKDCSYRLYTEVTDRSYGSVDFNQPTCAMYGIASVKTFDNLEYMHSGVCKYTMMRRVDDGMSTLSIDVTRKPDCSKHGDCVRSVQITHAMCDITLYPNTTILDFRQQGIKEVGINERFEGEGLEIVPGSMRKVRLPNAEITLLYDGRSDVIIYLWPDFGGHVEGLCGNLNGIDVDDQEEISGERFREYGCTESYQVPVEDTECVDFSADVLNACYIMTSESFGYCNEWIDPRPFIKQCVKEMCMCNYMENAHCMCDIIQQYTRMCALVMAPVYDWRTSACEVDCLYGMKYTECGWGLAPTCANKYIAMAWSRSCSPRCECAGGTYWDPLSNACIDGDKCSCEMDSEVFPHGHVIIVGREQSTCNAGWWESEILPLPGIAMAYGHNHYKSFDGTYFTQGEECALLFAQDEDASFMVYIQTYSDGTFYAEKDVHVMVLSGGIYYHYLLERNGLLSLHVHDGSVGMNSQALPHFKPGIADITRFGDRGFDLLLVESKVRVQFDGLGFVSLVVPGKYSGKMRGLAGNFNGDMSDDMKMPSKELAYTTDFVRSWKKDTQCEGTFLYHPSICWSEDIEAICETIIRDSLSECGNFVDLDQLQQMCVEDACNANLDNQDEITCQFVKSVDNLCALYEVHSPTPEILESQCPILCPASKVLSECSSSCQSSCSSIGLFCATQCYKGCFCPEGTYENFDGSCVPEEGCGCFYEGEWFAHESQNSFNNDSKECTCVGGKMDCRAIYVECSGEMEYYDCAGAQAGFSGTAAMATCEQPFRIAMSEECASGCACAPGTYMTPDHRCVPLAECGCVGANNKYYQPGEGYTDECNQCTCNAGQFVCTDEPCPKTCSSSGGSHYQTFDGLMYDFHGECEYVLASDFCPNNPGGGLFSIITKNQRCGTTGITCSKEVTITIKNKQIVLRKGTSPNILTVPGASRFRRAITGSTDYSAAEIFLIKQKGLFTEITTCIGITVLWDNGTRIYVRLTPEYQGKVCGMCGNFDGHDSNDLITSSGNLGTVIQAGNSWKASDSSDCKDATRSSQVNDSCSLRPERREWAEKKCALILDNELFGECHSKVNPQKYYQACVLDTCGCDSGGDCECRCTAVAHYAHLCAQKGVVVEWRNMKTCPLMCESYNEEGEDCRWHYRACDTCITDTCCPCQSPSDTNWCVEGCFPKCPEGYILDEMTQKCLLKENADQECTPYSAENKCRVCETCDVCKTKSGATLRIEPGQTIFFPLDTDTCEREWCAATTDGDLCYNGTVDLYICAEEEKPIPDYDPIFYELTCVNSTTSVCKNCRDCEKNCIIREDSCEDERTIGDSWSKTFNYDPVPSIGPKTYCKNYRCVAHPDATEPQCNKQEEDVQGCVDSGKDKVCEWFEELREYPTGDPCCPVKYECVCITCQFAETGEMDSTIQVNASRYWCREPAESNCCYTDTCYEKSTEWDCPQIKKAQEACTTGPTPTCTPGYVWVNKTRTEDCCPWGECECDSCVDYNIQNNKVLRAIGDTWNKQCLKFKCIRGVRAEDGCFKTINYANETCSAAPDCPDRMHSVITGKDQFGCCDTFRCECDEKCFVTDNGTTSVYPPNTEWQMNGCWHHCTDPLDGATGPRLNQSECPFHEQICHKPDPCPTCHVIVGETKDDCGCTKYICEEIARCPLIKCDYPYQRDIVASDPCKAPCYNCTCDHVCWDQFDNRTYGPDEQWRRIYRQGERKCEDCVCNNDEDEDGCRKEACTRVPCKEVEKCPSPYDEAITDVDECGCTFLIECRCPYCKFEQDVLMDKTVGSTWTEGNVELGCYDTYKCFAVKDVGKDKECHNVTVERNPCPKEVECHPDYKKVKDEEKSCCYPDQKCCDVFKCICNVCMFEGESYKVGDKWTKDCRNYVCTDTVDEQDPEKCFLETYEDVPCLEPKPNCTDCYYSYLRQPRTVPEFCCDIFDCKPELICKHNGDKIANGTEWYDYEEDPNGCVKRQCYVSDADWSEGKCPTKELRDPCVVDTKECEKCQNKTIKLDVCECEYVTCPPLNDPVQCVEPAANQKIVSLATEDECFPSRNCCVCDSQCLYKGIRRKPYEVWWDYESCERMRCEIPGAALDMMQLGPDQIDDIKDNLDYRTMMEGTRLATFIYSECQQDPSMCPVARAIGCPLPKNCSECQTTTIVKDKCNCPVSVCEDYKCPPYPFNRTTCPPPKSRVVEVTLKDLHEYYPCCPVGNVCECPLGCYDTNGTLRDVGQQWEEFEDQECGTKRRYTCRFSREGDPDECPQVEGVPCQEPTPCPNCHVTMSSKDEYCCTQLECVPMVCNVTSQADCEEKYFPFTVMKTDAVKTKNECCPHYCECPDVCVDEFDQQEHDKNEKWIHPRSECWDRFCLVDKSKVIKQGCPYIVNKTVCVEPEPCDVCYHKVDDVDNCGCVQRQCVKDDCPRPNCTHECKEIVDSGLKDSCDCPVLECKLKKCPQTNLTCDDPEMDVFQWMEPDLNVCCPQFGCRCNFTRCEEAQCAPGEVAVRNLTDARCCCPKYDCISEPPAGDFCMIGSKKMKIGEKWINKDNHCEMMQCMYVNPHSKKTKIDIFPRHTCSKDGSRSARSTCSNNEDSYWADTKEGCCRESVCPCTCQLYGDPHYTTFDGFNFDFQGKCAYTLMKEYKYNETEIIVDNELCRFWSARNKDLSCLKTLVVLHKGVNYTFSFGQQFFLDGVLTVVNDAWQPEGSDVRIESYGYKTLQLRILSLGIELIYKTRTSHQSLILKMPYETYEGKMSGLCGTCNNNLGDDLIGRSRQLFSADATGDIDKFAVSWMANMEDLDHDQCLPVEPECPSEPEYPNCPTTLPIDDCVNCENKCHLAHEKCQVCEEDPCEVMVDHAAFEDCRLQVPPEGYLPQCRFDLSLVINVTSVKCDPCNSPAVVQYATMCETVGKCSYWRSALGCDEIECPANQEFRECEMDSLKYMSCDNLTVYDSGVRVEGCFCPEGTVRENAQSQNCVPTQCCFDCRPAPECEGDAVLQTQGEDECGCPIHYCQSGGGGGEACGSVEQRQDALTTFADGNMCYTTDPVTTSLCAGTCGSEITLAVSGEITQQCSSCLPVQLDVKKVTMRCLDGSRKELEIEDHISCACSATPCE